MTKETDGIEIEIYNCYITDEEKHENSNRNRDINTDFSPSLETKTSISYSFYVTGRKKKKK